MSVSAIGGFVRKMRARRVAGRRLGVAHRAPSARWTARAGTRTSDACASRRCWTPSACAWATPRSSGSRVAGPAGGPAGRAAHRRRHGRRGRCASASRRWRSGARTQARGSALALACLTHGGIPRSRYDALRREMVHAAGPPYSVLQRMEAGIAFAREDEKVSETERSAKETKALRDAAERRRRRRTAYAAVRRPLRLLVDDLDDANPNDIAYAYSHSGYAPLSVRLILAAVERGWRAIPGGGAAAPPRAALRVRAGPRFYPNRRGPRRARRGAGTAGRVRREGTKREARRFRRLKRTAARTAARWFWRFRSRVPETPAEISRAKRSIAA